MLTRLFRREDRVLTRTFEEKERLILLRLNTLNKRINTVNRKIKKINKLLDDAAG